MEFQNKIQQFANIIQNDIEFMIHRVEEFPKLTNSEKIEMFNEVDAQKILIEKKIADLDKMILKGESMPMNDDLCENLEKKLDYFDEKFQKVKQEFFDIDMQMMDSNEENEKALM